MVRARYLRAVHVLDTSYVRREWFRLVALMATVLTVTVALLPSATGVFGLVALLAVLRKRLGTEEALVGVFLVVTALASSRLGYHQYAKFLRLPLLLLLGYHGIRRFNTWPREHRRAHVRWALLVFLGVALPTFISQGLRISDPAILLLPGAWFIYGTLAFHASPAELQRRWDLYAVLLPAAYVSLFAFEALRGGDAFLVGRFRGWLGNPNEMSHWWLAGMAALMVGIGGAKNRRAFLFLIAVTVLLYLRSASRAPLGLTAVIAFGGLMMSGSLSRGMRYFGSLVVVAVALVLPFLSVEVLQDLLPQSMVRGNSLEEGGGRFVAWNFGWEELMRRPWLGGGAGFEEAYYGRHSELLSMLGHQGFSHNSYLAFSLNYGIPMAVALLGGLIRKLGLFDRSMFFLALLPFVLATFVEGVLTSPLNAVTPAWFFAAAWMGQKRKASAPMPSAE